MKLLLELNLVIVVYLCIILPPYIKINSPFALFKKYFIYLFLVRG